MSTRRHLGTAVLIAIVVATAAVEGADRATQAQIALSRCLISPGTPIPVEAMPVAVPPGLARASEVAVAVMPGSDNHVFAYRGTGGEIACGIAIYGKVSGSEKRGLVAILDRDKRWMRHPPGPYRLSGAHPAQQSYWGAPGASGVSGALMMERPPSAAAPALEIDVHNELIQ